MDIGKGEWDGHFYIPYGPTLITACGIKGEKVALAHDHDVVERLGRTECAECRMMMTCTAGWKDGELLLNESFYGNANGFAVVVVAVVTPCVDWTAYIGGADGVFLSEEQAVRFVARHGVKLPYEYARAFFPELPRRLFRR